MKPKTLAAAFDRHCSEIDVGKELTKPWNTKGSDTQIAALFNKSIIHQDRQIENDGLKSQDIFVELGKDLLKAISPK